jgi:hypothetical protein
MHRYYDMVEFRAIRKERDELRRLVLNLQAHAREHGWQDYDKPIAALLAWPASAAREQEK